MAEIAKKQKLTNTELPKAKVSVFSLAAQISEQLKNHKKAKSRGAGDDSDPDYSSSSSDEESGSD